MISNTKSTAAVDVLKQMINNQGNEIFRPNLKFMKTHCYLDGLFPVINFN
jgi:hypothetical protein